MSTENDILVDIPDEDLAELSRLYEKHLEHAFDAYCAIDNGLKWRRKTGDDSMVFLSPNSCWRKDGTFILLMRLAPSAYDIFVYTLDPECKNLVRGLRETKRIDYRGGSRVLFFSVRDQHYGPVRALTESKTPVPLVVVDTELFYMPIEEALKFDVSIPDEVHLDRLKPADAATVNEAWPHRYYGSEATVRRLIEVNGGLGLYTTSSPSRLVAWVLLGWLGQLVLLQVAEGSQRRGYAALLVKALSKEIARSGQVPYGTVVTKNTASLALFHKLKFRSSGITHFVSYSHEKE